MSSAASESFPSGHVDYLHDVCYDWYGERLATCSSDQKIRIFQRLPPPPPPSASASSSSSASASSASSSSFPYTCVAELRGHNGSIHRLSFAHPEYGVLLASCSSDRTVLIYEEQRDSSTLPPSNSSASSSPSSFNPRSGYTWKPRGRLVDSRVSVVDCEFGPHHLGLLLATLGLDGRLRIYESRDLMNLSVWGLQDEFHTAESAAASGPVTCSALTWNPSQFDPAMLAVACNHAVKVYECERGTNKWRQVVALTEGEDLIHDVAWAPNAGRSYHLLASAGKDGAVRVYTLRWEEKAGGGGGGSWQSACVGVMKGVHGGQQVWRVSWNSTGSMLASTGDDGCTRIWKSDYSLQWKQIAQTQTQPR